MAGTETVRVPPARRVRRIRRGAGALLAAAVLCGAAAGCGGQSPPLRVERGSSPHPAPARGSTHPSPPPAAARAGSVPVRLAVPAIGVDTPVVRLGLNEDGTVAVPPIAAHSPVGWYEGSPAPGRTGPSVLLGHVTVGRYGDGVFKRLGELRKGDSITAGLRDGGSARFRVYAVRTVAKSAFPTQAVYGNVDRPELRLITCGGPRTSDGAGYRDNVVVFASLVAPAAGRSAPGRSAPGRSTRGGE